MISNKATSNKIDQMVVVLLLLLFCCCFLLLLFLFFLYVTKPTVRSLANNNAETRADNDKIGTQAVVMLKARSPFRCPWYLWFIVAVVRRTVDYERRQDMCQCGYVSINWFIYNYLTQKKYLVCNCFHWMTCIKTTTTTTTTKNKTKNPSVVLE